MENFDWRTHKFVIDENGKQFAHEMLSFNKSQESEIDNFGFFHYSYWLNRLIFRKKMEAKYLPNDVSNDVRCLLEMFYSYEDIKDNLNIAIMLGGGRAYIWKMNEELKEYDLQVKYKEGTLHFEVCK